MNPNKLCGISPGVEDHGQRDSGDPFAGSHASCARDGGALGFQLHSEGFCDAAQEHVKDAELVPVTLLRGVDDVADVCRRQGLHPDDAGESHRCHLWKDSSEQRCHLRRGKIRQKTQTFNLCSVTITRYSTKHVHTGKKLIKHIV